MSLELSLSLGFLVLLLVCAFLEVGLPLIREIREEWLARRIVRRLKPLLDEQSNRAVRTHRIDGPRLSNSALLLLDAAHHVLPGGICGPGQLRKELQRRKWSRRDVEAILADPCAERKSV